MRRVIVLRPEPGASETVRKARIRGLQAVAIPLFAAGPIAWKIPDVGRFDALLLTSANAMRHGGTGLDALKSLPVHAVGEATAEAARRAGFAVVSIGEGGVDAALDSLDADLRLLHLCGEHRHVSANASQEITSVAVYRASERPTPDLCATEGAIVLIHSPRAARRFAQLVEDRRSIAIVAISLAVAEAVGRGWADVHSSETPSDDALLALAERLCNNPRG